MSDRVTCSNCGQCQVMRAGECSLCGAFDGVASDDPDSWVEQVSPEGVRAARAALKAARRPDA